MTEASHTTLLEAHQQRLAAGKRQQTQVARNIRRHSLIVKTLRWLLPVGCLVIVGVFLHSSGILEELLFPRPKEPPLVIAEKSVEMMEPRMSGLDTKERAYELSATTAKQNIDDPTKVTLEDLTGSLVLGGGQGRVHMVAKNGFLDTEANFLKLKKDIVVSTKKGHKAYLETADIKLKKKYVITKDPVLIEWKDGTIRSIGMEISNKGDVIRFLKNVKVRLNPNSTKKETN